MILSDGVTQAGGYAKLIEGTGCSVQILEHTYRYLADDFKLESVS